jgi:para-nitrobenzyl esterase
VPPGGPLYVSATGSLLSTLPNVDGLVLPAPLRQTFAAGNFERRPLVLGTNRDEGTLFHSSLFAVEVADDAQYRAALARRFGQSKVAAIVARYPVASFESPNRALAEVTGDAFFVCPARQTARGAAAAGAPVYLYSFEREPAQPFLPGLGVFHSAELPFLFGTDPAFPLSRVGEAGQPAADLMQQLWTRFAATGDPNADEASWPPFARTDERYLVLDTVTRDGVNHKRATCDFWDTLAAP